jgi:hypothetical protein
VASDRSNTEVLGSDSSFPWAGSYIIVYIQGVPGGTVVVVSAILSRKVYMYMCPIPNGFRDRAISQHSPLYTVQTSNTPCPHTSCKVH